MRAIIAGFENGEPMKKLLMVLEMVKFEHTVFALPFALLGAFLGGPLAATFGYERDDIR